MEKKQTYILRIMLSGDPQVGKSSLITRYFDDTFSDSYISSIGVDFRIKMFESNEKVFKTLVWDFHSSERYRPVPHYYYKSAHGIMLLYDVTDQESFDNLKYWIKEIQEKAPDDVNVIIIGTKSDLVSKKIIDTETGKNFAEQLGYPFFEISSKENININEAFETIIKQSSKKLKQNPIETKQEKKCLFI